MVGRCWLVILRGPFTAVACASQWTSIVSRGKCAPVQSLDEAFDERVDRSTHKYDEVDAVASRELADSSRIAAYCEIAAVITRTP